MTANANVARKVLSKHPLKQCNMRGVDKAVSKIIHSTNINARTVESVNTKTRNQNKILEKINVCCLI
jgi:hypothetical protein